MADEISGADTSNPSRIQRNSSAVSNSMRMAIIRCLLSKSSSQPPRELTRTVSGML